MTDLDEFKEQLGTELVAAAGRRAGEPFAVAAPRRRLAPLATVGLISLACLALVPFARPGSVDAETFEIEASAHATRLEIIDVIVDPEASKQQLEREVGIESEFIAVPTDVEIVGSIVAIGTTGPIQARLHADEGGFPSSIELPTNFDGVLTVMYGRPAEPGEPYGATRPHRQCPDLFGQTLAASMNDLKSIRPDLVVRVDLPNQRQNSTDLSLIPDDYVITTVQTVSDEVVRVGMSPPPLSPTTLDQRCAR